MIAIQTKYIPCTNHRPARVKAWDMYEPRDSVTISWDDIHSNEQALEAWAVKHDMKYRIVAFAATDKGKVYIIKGVSE